MALILPAASENNMLNFALGVTVPGNQYLKLYTNNVTTTTDTLVAADFTEMLTLGYSSPGIELTKTSWVVAQSGSVATATQSPQTWTFTAGTAVTVYGYYVTDKTTGLLLWFEAFSTAKVVQNSGDQIIITPTITLSKV
jgi:hypothetical protein